MFVRYFEFCLNVTFREELVMIWVGFLWQLISTEQEEIYKLLTKLVYYIKEEQSSYLLSRVLFVLLICK